LQVIARVWLVTCWSEKVEYSVSPAGARSAHDL